jgi:hypothetical protein
MNINLQSLSTFQLALIIGVAYGLLLSLVGHLHRSKGGGFWLLLGAVGAAACDSFLPAYGRMIAWVILTFSVLLGAKCKFMPNAVASGAMIWMVMLCLEIGVFPEHFQKDAAMRYRGRGIETASTTGRVHSVFGDLDRSSSLKLIELKGVTIGVARKVALIDTGRNSYTMIEGSRRMVQLGRLKTVLVCDKISQSEVRLLVGPEQVELVLGLDLGL